MNTDTALLPRTSSVQTSNFTKDTGPLAEPDYGSLDDRELAAEGVGARVVSLPSWELFDEQDEDYRDEVLPPSITARVAIEQASTLGWERYAGSDGAIIGMHTFGASAPLKQVENFFGFTPDDVVETARDQIARNG